MRRVFEALVCLLVTLFVPNLVHAEDQYDYIIVGSGPGGGPLASNLARANYSVLLVEAGDSNSDGGFGEYSPRDTWDFFVRHYADDKRNLMNHHLTWKLANGSYWVGAGSDTPPAGATFLGVYYPRGATIGGSSMINAMCTWYPSESDWNYVVNVTGDTSWSADSMRKYFERIEHNNYLPRGTPGHGFDGYFQVSMTKPTSIAQPLLGVMQAVASSYSIPTAQTELVTSMGSDANFLDPKRDWTTGLWGLPQHTYPNGTRYASKDYILSTIAAGYPLTLSPNSLATKILFSNSTCAGKPRATGLQYLSGPSLYKADARYTPSNTGTQRTATARKEVIISGGTFNTPQLLMISGIGPAAHLSTLKIPVLVDAPGVGQNLMDNQEMPIIGIVHNNSSTPFGSGQGFSMHTTPHSPDGERDIFTMQGPSFAFRGFWPTNQTNPNLPVDVPGTYGISMVKNHPQNRAGYVRLKTADPQDPPNINFNLYSEGGNTDLGAMLDTIAWARRIHRTAATFGVNITTTEPPCPSTPDSSGSCGQADVDWITGQTFGHHPTSTAKIGADDDPMAVLDSRFRVRGVSGLRVVDASVFPRIPGGFPVVSTFMVSEKAADVVKEDAGRDICAA